MSYYSDEEDNNINEENILTNIDDNVLGTVFSIIKLRKWEISSYDIGLGIILAKNNSDVENVVFKFVNSSKAVRLFLKDNLDLYDNIIMVCRNNITNVIKNIVKLSNKIETFLYNELFFDVTKHILQPKSFEKLSLEELKIFKNRYFLKKGSFPFMLEQDKIARFYRFKKGDVIRIVDKEDFVGFRIVK